MSDAAEIPETEEPPVRRPLRDRDLLGGARSKIRRHLSELQDTIAGGFEDQAPRSDAQADYWDIFNCVLNGNQFYNGNAQIYLPLVHDALIARATRFINQLFPQSGRYVEAITADGSNPAAIIGLVEHYLRSRRFKTQVLRPLSICGDVEGQYNLYVDWAEVSRQLVSRETHGVILDMEGIPVEAGGEEIEDVAEEEIIEGMPVFEVLHDCDVLILPETADSIDEALAVGGTVTIVRRWTRTKIDQMAEAGSIRAAEAKTLKSEMDLVARVGRGDRESIEERLAEHVGIRAKGAHATVWESWNMVPLDNNGVYSEDGTPRLCRMFFGPNRAQLGAKRNPYWNDRCPLLSCPVEKIAGVMKGPSPVARAASMQYEANDAVNEGADAATYAAAPIVTRDMEKFSGPLVFGVGAVWPIPPGSVELLQFPDLTPRAMERVQLAMSAIFQSLGVNPSMLPQQRTSEKSQTQAMIAQDQAVDLLTTAEAVSVMEEGICTPAMAWAVDLDYQFRDRALTVRAFGDMGVQAELEEIAPLQNRTAFSLIWRGGEQVKQAAMMQQQGTALLNVAMQPPLRAELMAEGYQLHIAPAFEAAFQSVFGAFIGSKMLIDQRHQLTMSPDLENDMLLNGMEIPVHPLDNDPEHLQGHQQAAQATGDPHGTIRVHQKAHLQSMQMKNAASMQGAMAQQGIPPPGGGAGGPTGAPGAPQPGAVPTMPHAMKRPPGAVHPDRAAMSGVMQIPRRM